METSLKSLLSLLSSLDFFFFIFFFIFFFSLFPLVSLFFLLSKKKKLTVGNLPPSPPGLPIIGNLHQLGKLPHQSLWKLSKKYGPVMLLKLGQIPTLVVSSPEMAKQVLKINDLECCSRPYSYTSNKFSYNSIDITFSPYNEYWKEMRKLVVVELFTLKKVQSFSHIRDVEIFNFIDSLYLVEGKSINLSERIFNVTNEIICQIAFGKSFGEKQFESANIQQVLNECFDVLSGFWATDFFPNFGWIIDLVTGVHNKLDKAFANLDWFLERVVEENLKSSRDKLEHKNIVEILLDLSKDQTCSVRLTRHHIKAVLMNIFLGGVDTTSITIEWAMTELVKNPRVMKKVQTEIRRKIGRKSKVNENEITKLSYLKMVVKEVLRLHPPVTLLVPRETMKHCKIGGYDVLPKTRVLVGAWAIGRDSCIWKDAEEFYPERFDNNDIDFKGAHFELVPFGAGRRICPGITMAVNTIEMMLANLLYCFDWELPPGMKIEDINMKEEGGLTMHKKLPLYLVPIKYKWED